MSVLAWTYLAAVSFTVGLFIGAVGIGGILLIPALTVVGLLSLHASTATALFTFFFTGMLGAYLFRRWGNIDWRTCLPVCAGALAFSFIGAVVNSRTHAAILARVIGFLILFAGIYVLIPARQVALRKQTATRWSLLFAVGAVSGFGSGLSGAGGPLFSVPIMLALGFSPLMTIGVSQVLQIVSAASGTLANLAFGSIDFAVALWITPFELGGVVVGVWAAHKMSMQQLRTAAASLCIVAGAFMLLHNT